MDWPRLTFGTRPTLALPEACCTQLAMRLGREPSSYPIRHARPVERFGIRGTIPLSRACLSLFELLTFRQIIPPDRAVTIGHRCEFIVLQVLQAVCVEPNSTERTKRVPLILAPSPHSDHSPFFARPAARRDARRRPRGPAARRARRRPLAKIWPVPPPAARAPTPHAPLLRWRRRWACRTSSRVGSGAPAGDRDCAGAYGAPPRLRAHAGRRGRGRRRAARRGDAPISACRRYTTDAAGRG